MAVVVNEGSTATALVQPYLHRHPLRQRPGSAWNLGLSTGTKRAREHHVRGLTDVGSNMPKKEACRAVTANHRPLSYKIYVQSKGGWIPFFLPHQPTVAKHRGAYMCFIARCHRFSTQLRCQELRSCPSPPSSPFNAASKMYLLL